MDDPDASANMTLVGMALRAQKPGQDFSTAAVKTLRKHFPGIPSDVLVQRASNLQRARDQLIVQKYGSVITMRPASATPSASSQELTSCASKTSRTSSPILAESPTRWSEFSPSRSPDKSPSRASPSCRGRPPHMRIRLSDLDGHVVTDADSDGDDSKHTKRVESPQSTLQSIRSPRRRPHDLCPSEPRTPKRGDPKKAIRSPQTAIKCDLRKMQVEVEAPATVIPVVDAHLGGGHYTRSKNISPVKHLLNNRAARLRTRSNLSKLAAVDSLSKRPLNSDIRRSKSPAATRVANVLEETSEFLTRYLDKFEALAIKEPTFVDGTADCHPERAEKAGAKVEKLRRPNFVRRAANSPLKPHKGRKPRNSPPPPPGANDDIRRRGELTQPVKRATHKGHDMTDLITCNRHPTVEDGSHTGFTTPLFASQGSRRSDLSCEINDKGVGGMENFPMDICSVRPSPQKTTAATQDATAQMDDKAKAEHMDKKNKAEHRGPMDVNLGAPEAPPRATTLTLYIDGSLVINIHGSTRGSIYVREH
ncbi:hypothetical protein DRE_00248 [Drechslerella stenobrocha 248]|uniref:Uncharacterized protein n=1 Tax=Drechslerella stenobrocha 248 TaxID=1043628 RepID=W7I9E4_9PEZI|nr:hypothetical protein DRE_00248 [Drechslerella stenobrocha 248]